MQAEQGSATEILRGVARPLDVIGDRWSLLIIRDALDGLRGFGAMGEDFFFAAGEPHVQLVDKLAGKPVRRLEMRSQDGRLLGAQHTVVRFPRPSTGENGARDKGGRLPE